MDCCRKMQVTVSANSGTTCNRRWRAPTSWVAFRSARRTAYADKLSMAHSLEVRVPYLDREIVEVRTKTRSGYLRPSRSVTVRESGSTGRRVCEGLLPSAIFCPADDLDPGHAGQSSPVHSRFRCGPASTGLASKRTGRERLPLRPPHFLLDSLKNWIGGSRWPVYILPTQPHPELVILLGAPTARIW